MTRLKGVLLLLLCQFSYGDHQDKNDVFTFSLTTVTYSNDNIATTVFNDYNLYTGVTMTEEMGQIITIDWSRYDDPYVFIQGVFIQVKEQDGMSGQIIFELDGEECADTNGVGDDGKGGLFNCDGWG